MRSEEEIVADIDETLKPAEKRLAEASEPLRALRPAVLDWATKEEHDKLVGLRLELMLAPETSVAAAKARVAAKRADRLKETPMLISSDGFEPIVAAIKWRKKCPPSVVLFATDGYGVVSIIDHQGPDADYLMGDSLLRETFVKNDLEPWAFPGIWIWEGRVRSYRDYWGEYDEENEGEVRPLTSDERRAVREEDIIWDGSLWIEDWRP